MTTKTKKQFKPIEYVYFVFTRPSNAGYGFSSYTDYVGALGKPGTVVQICYQLDKNQKPIPYHFSMGLRDRVIRVEANKVDMFGTSVVEFLRNAPGCLGSPNGSYLPDGTQVEVYFKELNEEVDAEKALEAKEYRLQAETLAASMPADEVMEFNAMLGVFKKGEKLSRHFLMELAGNKPQVFMEYYNNPKRKALALIKRGLHSRVLKQNGTVVAWNDTVLGLDEDDAASKLMQDAKLFDALSLAVSKAKP